MMKNQIIALLTLLFASSTVMAQECKVLLPSIAGVYEGECDKSKANGM